MLLVPSIGKNVAGSFFRCIVIISVIALCGMMARYAAPRRFEEASVYSLAIDQRQSFDVDSEWVVPARVAAEVPCLAVISRPSPTAEPPIETATDGWHYNRPPPLG